MPRLNQNQIDSLDQFVVASETFCKGFFGRFMSRNHAPDELHQFEDAIKKLSRAINRVRDREASVAEVDKLIESYEACARLLNYWDSREVQNRIRNWGHEQNEQYPTAQQAAKGVDIQALQQLSLAGAKADLPALADELYDDAYDMDITRLLVKMRDPFDMQASYGGGEKVLQGQIDRDIFKKAPLNHLNTLSTASHTRDCSAAELRTSALWEDTDLLENAAGQLRQFRDSIPEVTYF